MIYFKLSFSKTTLIWYTPYLEIEDICDKDVNVLFRR